MNQLQLPIPEFFAPQTVGTVYRVPYQQRATEAENWAKKHNISPAKSDKIRIGLLLIDVQNTFCIPDFELFVGGRSSRGAVEDNVRLCEFIYRNLNVITEIIPTMDSHTAMQIFHPIFWINDAGEHPAPASGISLTEVERGIWKVNPNIAYSLNYDGDRTQQHALHYVKKLSDDGKYPLIIWPYHSMLGGIGHALVSAVEEAVFFHNLCRYSQTQFELKGSHPLTENYSVLSPEVVNTADGGDIVGKNTNLIQKLLDFDVVIIAGQAKSHCVAWTIDDLLTEIKHQDPNLAQKVYLLEDCTSPVVVPGIVDFTPQADAAFQRFANAGMKIIKSSEEINIPILGYRKGKG
jgi:nicotinamidase-related amidase